MLTEEQKAEIEQLVESCIQNLLNADTPKELSTAEVVRRLHETVRSVSGRHADPVLGQQKVVPGEQVRGKIALSGALQPVPQSLEPLVRVIARAIEVLGTSEKALRWINAPVRSLGNQTPISLLDSPEGIERVEDALGSIEHGVW